MAAAFKNPIGKNERAQKNSMYTTAYTAAIVTMCFAENGMAYTRRHNNNSSMHTKNVHAPTPISNTKNRSCEKEESIFPAAIVPAMPAAKKYARTRYSGNCRAPWSTKYSAEKPMIIPETTKGDCALESIIGAEITIVQYAAGKNGDRRGLRKKYTDANAYAAVGKNPKSSAYARNNNKAKKTVRPNMVSSKRIRPRNQWGRNAFNSK